MLEKFIAKPIDRRLEARMKRLTDLEKEGNGVLVAVKYELFSPEIVDDSRRIGICVGFTKLPICNLRSQDELIFTLDGNIGDKRYDWEHSNLSFETNKFLDYCLLDEKYDFRKTK